MDGEKILAVVPVRSKNSISLPVQIMRKFDVQKGDYVKFVELPDGSVVFRKVKP